MHFMKRIPLLRGAERIATIRVLLEADDNWQLLNVLAEVGPESTSDDIALINWAAMHWVPLDRWECDPIDRIILRSATTWFAQNRRLLMEDEPANCLPHMQTRRRPIRAVSSVQLA